MNCIMKKILNIIFKLWNFTEKGYGSKEISFRESKKLPLILLICWIVVVLALIKAEQFSMKILLIWLAILLPIEFIFVISTYFYLKKENSNINRRLKENLFYISIGIFTILILPYLLVSKIADNLDFQKLFNYGDAFIFEMLLLMIITIALVHAWARSDENLYIDISFIILSFIFFVFYFPFRNFIRWIFIREKYYRCEYILEYNTLIKGIYVIGSLILTIMSFYFKAVVIVLILYMTLDTLLEELKRHKREYDLVLKLFKETLFVLDKTVPTIKSYDNLVICFKYSIDKNIIESYATVYKDVNNTWQGKRLQKVLDIYNELLNRKYDCTKSEDRDAFHKNIRDALNISAGYLQNYIR